VRQRGHGNIVDGTNALTALPSLMDNRKRPRAGGRGRGDFSGRGRGRGRGGGHGGGGSASSLENIFSNPWAELEGRLGLAAVTVPISLRRPTVEAAAGAQERYAVQAEGGACEEEGGFEQGEGGAQQDGEGDGDHSCAH